jgi:hypothetical protein
MNFVRALSILLIINLFWSCRPDPALPSWDIEALTPLANSRLDIGDIFMDSSLTVNSDGSLSLVFTSDLAELKPDEVISPLNASFSNTLTLQNINLGTPSFNDFISLGDLSKGGSPAGQFIIANHGNTAVAPSFLNVGPKAFNVNASNIFQDIILVQGSADVVFQNELPVALTDIDFRLENQSSGVIIFQDMIDTIPPMQTISRNFDLSGQTIEGNMKAVLQNFSSPGSGMDTVFIDTSDRITVSVTLKDLRPSSATAIFPDQDLATDTNYSDPVPAGNAQLTSIVVDQGSIYLDASSTIDDILKLDYLIPSATTSGIALSLNEQIPAAPPGGVSTSYEEVDIAGYNLDLTGQPGDVGIYNQFYTILNARIDSSGRLINLSTTDSVLLKTGVVDLTARRGYGYLGKDTLSVQETSTIEIFDMLQSGSFDLEEAIIGFSVENFIGAPLEMKLNDMFAQSAQTQKTLVWDQLGQFLSVPAAGLAEPVPVPGYLQVNLNSANSNFDELIELQPSQITTDIEAIINGAVASPVYNQFIYSQYGVRSSLFLEIPLHLSLTDIMLSDTSEFNYEAFDPRKQVQDGSLKVLADNYFPLQADLVLIMLDQNDQIIDSLTSADQIEAPLIAPNGKPAEVKRSIAEYPLDQKRLDQLYNTRKMLIQVTINTPATPDKVRLFQDNYMDLTLTGDLRIRTR